MTWWLELSSLGLFQEVETDQDVDVVMPKSFF